MTNWCREFEVNVNMYSLCLSKEENSKQFKNSLKFHASIRVLTVFFLIHSISVKKDSLVYAIQKS